MESRDAGFRGSLAEAPLPQVLRRILLERLKGTLWLTRGDETRSLFFEEGELRAATSSREGQRIGAFLKRRGWITDRDLAWALETASHRGRVRLGRILVERGLLSRAVLEAEMRRLVEEIVFSIFEWGEGDFRFTPSAGVLDPDAALPLSTAAIIVEGIRRLPESDAFRERLGERKRVAALAGDPTSRYQHLALTPQEAYLLSRVDGVLDLDTLLKLGGASRSAAAKTLYALFSCGIIEWKSKGPVLPATARPEGVNVETTEQPLARSPGDAEMVRSTYRRIDWLTHYELLGIGSESSPEEIRRAYLERSRSFHPNLCHRPDLADCGNELTTVFSRLKTAYKTLSDPKQRAEYDTSLTAPASLAIEQTADPHARAEMAAKTYARARRSIEERDFHPAVEMLRQAVRFAPDNAEYRFCLGQVELQNPGWIERGLENLMEAARLEPRRQQYLCEAARALLCHGRRDEAALFAGRAFQLDPSPENQQLLDEILEETGTAASARAKADATKQRAARQPGLAARHLAAFFARLFGHRA